MGSRTAARQEHPSESWAYKEGGEFGEALFMPSGISRVNIFAKEENFQQPGSSSLKYSQQTFPENKNILKLSLTCIIMGFDL